MNFKWLDFKITKNCNNHCTYCGVDHTPPGSPEFLSDDDIVRTINAAIDQNFSHIALLGGEPSIRENIPLIFPRLQDAPELTLLLITNGLVFHENMYRAAFNSKIGTVKVIFSFDSFVKPNNKHQDPSFTLKSINRIRRMAMEYSGEQLNRSIEVHSVISRENYQKIIPHVDYFLSKNIELSMALVCPSSFSERIDTSKYNQFSFEDLDEILKQLRELKKRRILNFGHQVLLDYLEQYPYGTLSMASDCNAGINHVVINFDGEVYPCVTESYRQGIRFGNIRVDPFPEIMEKMSEFQCRSEFAPACWDHYLWNRLEDEIEREGAWE